MGISSLGASGSRYICAKVMSDLCVVKVDWNLGVFLSDIVFWDGEDRSNEDFGLFSFSLT